MNSHERARHFDSYISSVEVALNNPAVRAELGAIATSLLEVNQEAFLPNERFGKVQIPKKFRDNPNATAIIPATDDEAAKAHKLIKPISEPCGPWKKLGDKAASPLSGISLDTAPLLHRWDTMTEPAPELEGLASRSGARASVGFILGSDDQGRRYYKPTHPIVVVKAELLKDLDTYNQAATIAHEEAHAFDIVNNSLLFCSPLGGASSELVAYHVSHTIYSQTDQPFEGKEFAQDVEEWRLQNTSTDAPFVPSESDLPHLKGWIT